MNSISTKFFTVNKETKVFSAEASSLPDDFNPMRTFALKSHITLAEAVFQYEKTDIQGSEIQGWWFTVLPRYEKIHPHLKGWKVLIIND